MMGPSFTVSEFTVLLSGVISSLLLAYRLPIEVPDESTLFAVPNARSLDDSWRVVGLKSGCAEMGTMRTLVGTTERGVTGPNVFF
jgi:hypothetical protein